MQLTHEHAAALQQVNIAAQPGVTLLGCGTLAAPSALWPGSFISTTDVGAYSYIVGNAEICNCAVGNYTSIAKNCTIALNHPLDRMTTSPVSYAGLFTPFPGHRELPDYPRTNIGSDVWIGACVCIKGGVNIGHGAIVGAGAVVTRDIPPYAVAAGNPARVIRHRFAEDIVERLLRSRWFDYDWSTHPLSWESLEKSLAQMETLLSAGAGVPHSAFFAYAAEQDKITVQKISPAERERERAIS